MCLHFNVGNSKHANTSVPFKINKDLSMMWGECCTHYIHIFVNDEVSTDERVRAIPCDISKSFDGDKKYVAVQQ